MSSRPCIRGCVVRGRHFAACSDYGRDDGDCSGCATAEARDDVMLCHRCYGRLRRRIETAPQLLEHLRTMTLNVGRARRYDIERRARPEHTHAPVDPDLLDATRDIASTVYAELPDAPTPGQVREAAHAGITHIIDHNDDLANDADSIIQWWQIVMALEIPTAPDFWTITRALARWPLEDRRHWARAPCPGCDYRMVTVSPPAYPGGPSWYACQNCDWERSDQDERGRYRELMGPFDANRAPAYPETNGS